MVGRHIRKKPDQGAHQEQRLNTDQRIISKYMSSWRDDIRNYIVASVNHHLTEESEQADQPKTVKVALRPHQLTLLADPNGKAILQAIFRGLVCCRFRLSLM